MPDGNVGGGPASPGPGGRTGVSAYAGSVARPLVMGVLNVTPDSFSDGGRYVSAKAALRHGRVLVSEGADVVDVGGESTRPGAAPVAEAEELRRVLPVVSGLAGEVRVSIDTQKAAVAVAAVEAGASLVNDVSASLAEVAAATGSGWVAMHRRGTPVSMDTLTDYGDLVGEVRGFLAARLAWGRSLGLTEIWVDPGFGFAKNAAQNLELLARLDELVADGAPVLVGTSRKRFLGTVTARPGEPVPGPDDRAEPSLATSVAAMLAGAAMVRVHDVAAVAQAARLLDDQVVAGPR